MHNIFLDYPEFINSDVRTQWKSNTSGHYTVSAEFQYHRHNIALPAEVVKGKRVLDLGCLIGAGGAWCLANGATSYIGVELQREFTDIATPLFEKYFTDQNWQILQQSFSDFFNNNQEQFDIVIGYGITHSGIDLYSLLANISKLNASVIALDSKKPPLITEKLAAMGVDQSIIDQIDKLSIVEIFDFGMPGPAGKKYSYRAPLTTASALIDIMSSLGYATHVDHTSNLKTHFPDIYSGRYSINFYRSATGIREFETVYTEVNK